jgi:hypothetical protein
MKMKRAAAAAAALGFAATYHAHAIQQVKSLYTVIDLDNCKAVATHPDGREWLCEGLPGYPVYIAEGDLRVYLSAGPKAAETRAAKQTLVPFNTVFEGNSNRTTVEWRFIIRDGNPVPYAAIVRYFTSSDETQGQVLVVTRVTDTEACHVAYIDALANTDAIVMARRVADEKARAFNCQSEPARIGTSGKSPM